MLKLLLRLYEPDTGSVTVDGVPVQRLSFASLRGATGFVPQDVFLFHGSVRDNIAYGRPDATDEQIHRAAELAEADVFIRAMPHGYDSMVGERGQKLSGGQRQRITIARALLRDPAVLLLDEATSAIDNETEAAIQASLAHVTADRTTIVIAHRLSTIRHAHRIHVMEAGRIVEAGTHDELVGRGGLYAALWRVQTGELRPELVERFPIGRTGPQLSDARSQASRSDSSSRRSRNRRSRMIAGPRWLPKGTWTTSATRPGRAAIT